MFEVERIEDWQGKQVVDSEGEKIGKLEEVFADTRTGEPRIGSIATGLFGRKVSLVPLESATLTPESLRLPYTKEQVKGAPQADSGGQLDGERERDLFNYFGIEQAEPTGDEGSTVRYETAAASADRSAEAEDLRRRAAELEQAAERDEERAAAAEQAAQDARDTHGEASEQRDSELSEAERLRREADEVERR